MAENPCVVNEHRDHHTITLTLSDDWSMEQKNNQTWFTLIQVTAE